MPAFATTRKQPWEAKLAAINQTKRHCGGDTSSCKSRQRLGQSALGRDFRKSWYKDCHLNPCVVRTFQPGGPWRCNMPVKYPDQPDQIDQKNKPSQAEGQREQPGEEQQEKEFMEPTKPSQAEGGRKPYQ